MLNIYLANVINMAVIMILIIILIKIFERLTRRNSIKFTDTANTIISQVKTYVIKQNQKKNISLFLELLSNDSQFSYLQKDHDAQQEIAEIENMQNERKLMNFPAFRKSQVTTSHSIVKQSRQESRMDKSNNESDIQQNNCQTPQNKTTRKQIEYVENAGGEMSSKIKCNNILTPPRPTQRKMENQNNKSTNSALKDELNLKNSLIFRMLYTKSLRRFHSLVSMIEYLKVYRIYKKLNQPVEGNMYCNNQCHDLDMYSHSFQLICFFVNAFFFSVCICSVSVFSNISIPLIVIFILNITLNIILLNFDFKYQKIQIQEFVSSTEQQIWEQVLLQQHENVNQQHTKNIQAQIIELASLNQQPSQSKRSIPLPQKQISLSSRRNSNATYPIQIENFQNENKRFQSKNYSGDIQNQNNELGGKIQDKNDDTSNVKQIKSQGVNKIINVGIGFQNTFNNNKDQLNHDYSKSSGINSISDQQNNNAKDVSLSSCNLDIRDEVQILLKEKLNLKRQIFHKLVFLLTVLLGSISIYILFNHTSTIGGIVILSWFIVLLVDNLLLRFIFCFSYSLITYIRYKTKKNIELRQELNQEICWELEQVNNLITEKSILEPKKSPCKQQSNIEVKSPSKSQNIIDPIKYIIKESIRKITSPSKKKHQNSPMKDIEQQQDEIRFIPDQNQIQIRHLLLNQDGKNGLEFDTQTQQDYSINNISVNHYMQKVNLIRKGNNSNNQSQDSLDVQEEIAIKRINNTPASQAKNQFSNQKNLEHQKSKVKEFVLDSHRNPHIRIYSDRNQNPLRHDNSQNGVNFSGFVDTYIDGIYLQGDPQLKDQNKQNNQRKSSIGLIAPLQSTIIYNIINNSTINEAEIHSGSLCGINKKSQRSYRSKNDFHTSTEQQNKEYHSRNKIVLENTQNEIRSFENFDNSMQPLRVITEQGFRDSSFLHHRSMNVCDQSNTYTAGDISQIHDQSNMHIKKNDSSFILGDINPRMNSFVNNILENNESSNPHRYQTWDKNSTIDNNTQQVPNSAENRYIQDSKERLQAIQTRNIQQQIALKQRRDQQLLIKQNEEGNRRRNKSEEGRISVCQNNEIYIINQKKCTIDDNKSDPNNSIDVQNRKVSLSAGNFYESKNKKESNFANQLHKETSINNQNYQLKQLQQLNYTNSLSFLNNQTQNDGTMMIMQQQSKDLSMFFNNISDNENSVQNNHTSPENKRIMKKKILSPIPPTDLKELESINNEESCKIKKRSFETDSEGEDEQNYKFNRIKGQNSQNKNILLQSYNVQQIKGFDLNTSEQPYSCNPSRQQSEMKQNNNDSRKQSILNNIEISENILLVKSHSNSKFMENMIEQDKEKENNNNMRSLDADRKNKPQSYISNPGTRKNSNSQLNVPLKNIVKKKEQEKVSNCSPYLEFLPNMLTNQKDQLKQKEIDLKSKLERNKHSRRGSRELNDKIKGVIDLYGFEIQQNDQRNIIVSKKSSRSIKSQDSKRSIDNGEKEYFDNIQQNYKLPLQDIPKNNLSGYQKNQSDQSNSNIEDTSFGNQKKQYSHQVSKLKKPPMSSQNNIQMKNFMYKESKQEHPNSARAKLNQIALRQTTTQEGYDMSTAENNIITQSNNNDGFFDRNQDFAMIRPNNQQSIQFDVTNLDRQDNRFSFNEEYNFDTYYQNNRLNSTSSYQHSQFGMQLGNKYN